MSLIVGLFAVLGPLVLAVTVVAAWRGSKSRSVADAANITANQAASAVDVLKEEMAVYKNRSDRLSDELSNSRAENAAQAAQIESLKQRTDLQPVMERLAQVAEDTSGRHAVFERNTEAIATMVTELVKLTRTVMEEVQGHETRAQERHGAMLAAMERIAA